MLEGQRPAATMTGPKPNNNGNTRNYILITVMNNLLKVTIKSIENDT